MRPALLATLALLALMAQAPDAVRYVDVALEAGLRDIFYCGGERTKNYIIETLGSGVAFIDYDNDGNLDIFAANYVQFDQKNTPTPNMPGACQWKNMPVMCGPRGLKGGVNRLWRNDSTPGHLKFTDVSEASKVTAPGERYSLSVTTLDYDHDGWPDLYAAVDSQASILY